MYGSGPAAGITASAMTAGVGSLAYASYHTLSYMLFGIAAIPVCLVLLRLAFHRRTKQSRTKQKGRP